MPTEISTRQVSWQLNLIPIQWHDYESCPSLGILQSCIARRTTGRGKNTLFHLSLITEWATNGTSLSWKTEWSMYYILCAHIVLQPLTLQPAIQANLTLYKMNGSSSTLFQLCDNLPWLLHISQSFTTKDLPSFGLFIMFFNFYQLDLRNETSVALANLWWSIDKNQRSCDLVTIMKSACVLNF